MNSTVKTVLFWLLIVVSAALLWEVVKGARDGQKDKEVNAAQFMSDVDQNNVREFTVNGMEVRGKYRDGSAFHTDLPGNYFTPEVLKGLREKGVVFTFRDINSGSLPLQLLGTWAPLILLAALWFFMIRQMQTGGNKALSFGKSRARLLSMQQKKVTFKDVAGVEEAKEELREILSSCARRRSFRSWAGVFRRACCWSGLRERARRCWHGRLRARPMFPSSRFRALTSWKCSLALERAGCATCSSRARRMLLALFSSMKLTPSDGTVARAWAAVTTNASRR